MGRVEKSNDLKCWEFFNCINKEECIAYVKNPLFFNKSDCWELIENCLVGGVAKRGPCALCKFNALKYPDLSKFQNILK